LITGNMPRDGSGFDRDTRFDVGDTLVRGHRAREGLKSLRVLSARGVQLLLYALGEDNYAHAVEPTSNRRPIPSLDMGIVEGDAAGAVAARARASKTGVRGNRRRHGW
jgi:hypothetical protein